MSEAYQLGFQAGKAVFYFLSTAPNPYAVGTEEHDQFEQGLEDAYNESIELEEWSKVV